MLCQVLKSKNRNKMPIGRKEKNMKERNISLKVTVDTPMTSLACETLRKFPLEKTVDVQILHEENSWAEIFARFYLETHPDFNMGYQLDVYGAFQVGCVCQESKGLHDIMIESGFSEEIASRVFKISRFEETVFEK